MNAADRRAEAREKVEEATRKLMSSEGFQRWVETRSRFHRYSFHNTLLIASQRPDATRVAGYRAWQKLGRQVMKGESGIRIFAPMVVKVRSDQDDDAREVRVLFKVVSVFDVSQTEGEPLPELQREPITGDSHAEYVPMLEGFAGSIGFGVTYQDTGGPEGWCRPDTHEIAVREGLPPNATVHVLVHEIAHALGIGYREYGREAAEVIVETATAIVCGAVGLEVSGEAIPYLAAWSSSPELKELEAFAATIDSIASKLEGALGMAERRERADVAA